MTGESERMTGGRMMEVPILQLLRIRVVAWTSGEWAGEEVR